MDVYKSIGIRGSSISWSLALFVKNQPLVRGLPTYGGAQTMVKYIHWIHWNWFCFLELQHQISLCIQEWWDCLFQPEKKPGLDTRNGNLAALFVVDRQHRLLHAEVSTGFFHPVLPQHARGPHPQEQDHDFDGTMEITIHEYLLGYGTWRIQYIYIYMYMYMYLYM